MPEKENKPTQTQLLLSLVSSLDMFHTREGEVFVKIPMEDHTETWNVRSKGFRRWLAGLFYQSEGKAPSAQAMNDALTTAEGIGQFERPEAQVHVRIAADRDLIYLDLGNEKWEVVEISAAGWLIVRDAPVNFRRPKGLMPLPYPDGAGDLVALRSFFNLPDGDGGDAAWKLIVAWLIQAARPRGPYPVLVLNGEQGSAKSTLSRILKATFDPSTVPLRTMPASERDLAISAGNTWVLAFDNISGIRDWLSDAVCRLSTGGGFSTRQLWTDDEECLFSSSRPVVLNGIDQMVDRHDLADRCIFLNLPSIPEGQRKTENDLWEGFDKEHPRILGALLNCLSKALAKIGETKLTEIPRMADFALWVRAAESALPWDDNGFLPAYRANRKEIVALALDADTVATRIMAKISEGTPWEGTATELIGFLEEGMTDLEKKRKEWPKGASALSNRLRRLANFLRCSGTEVTFHPLRAGRRLITIDRKKGKNAVTRDTAVTPQKNQASPHNGDNGDARNAVMREPQHSQARNGDNDDNDEKSTLSGPPSPDRCDGCDSFDLVAGWPGCLRANEKFKDMERCPLKMR